MIRIIFLLVCCLSFLDTFAQNPISKFGSFGFQFQQVDFSDFNQQSQDLGFGELDNFITEFNGGGIYMKNRWKSTYSFSLAFSGDLSAQNGPTARYEYVQFVLGTAFNILPSDSKWFIGPDISIIPRAEQILLTQDGLVSGLANAGNASHLRLTRFSSPVDLGINIHRLIQLSKDQKKSMMVTLRAGYRLDGEPEAWRIDQGVNIIDNGIRTDGMYFGISLGFGPNE